MSAPVTAVVTKLSPGAASGLRSTAQIGSQSTRLHSPRLCVENKAPLAGQCGPSGSLAEAGRA
eukprot:scaffold100167_cov65-Phaeocystis_antarctica.AAC.2